MFKYIVELGYNNTYEFDTPSAASNFAEVALEHRVEREAYTRITLQVVDEDNSMFVEKVSE